MAQYTLLQLTQKCLTAMGSDDINAITDTEEALEVVDIIEDTYYELMSQKQWNHLKNPLQLEGLSDTDFPTTLKIPDTVVEMGTDGDALRYEVRDSASDDLEYKKLIYRDPVDFTEYVLNRNSTDSDVATKTVKGTNAPLLIKTAQDPVYWTSYDDKFIVLDAYDSSVDSTVQGNKSLAYCVSTPVFDPTDGSYVPECPISMFPTLLAESKRACFFYLKQQSSPIDNERALRGRSIRKNKNGRAHERNSRARYGRR